MSSPNYFTTRPLVVFGASGLLSSTFAFMAGLESFSPTVVLQGSDESRLTGLRDELEESHLPYREVHTTTSVSEAASYGGYVLYARSIRAAKQTREEMLLLNAPYAYETGRALACSGADYERIVCVANPSDLMGLMLLVHSGIDPHRVCSLSALDTLRFERTLRRRFGTSRLEQVLTLGSHDTAMALMLDAVRVDGRPLSSYGLTGDDYAAIDRSVRGGGISIYKHRGHTAYQSPAVVALQMLMASDAVPFGYPAARYHHSIRYPYSYGALPTCIDDSGVHHDPIALTSGDAERLDAAFASIAAQREVLIREGWLPPVQEWRAELQEPSELVTLSEEVSL